MSRLAAIDAAAAPHGLIVSGALHTTADDALPDIATIVLLSPDEPAFWPHFQASPEAKDGAPDPLDRWSARTITALAQAHSATPLFPFGGPPWHPFIAWAKRSGRAFPSPVGLLVHDSAGLFISYRGALGLAERLTLPPLPAASPCERCPAPCERACPVAAFASGSYDVPACKAHLHRPEGKDCFAGGCLTRRACPVGAERRKPEQSAFHMRAFR